MNVKGIEEIVSLTADSAVTFSTDFVLPKGAAGVEVYVLTADRQGAADWTASLLALTPDASAVSKITSAAIVSNTLTRIAVLPGVLTVANQIANDVLPGKARLTLTRSAGSYDFRCWAVYYGD